MVGVSGPMSCLEGVAISGLRSLLEIGYVQGVGTQPLRHGTLKECGGWGRTWDTMGYDLQAGSTHPIGMLILFLNVMMV